MGGQNRSHERQQGAGPLPVCEAPGGLAALLAVLPLQASEQDPKLTHTPLSSPPPPHTHTGRLAHVLQKPLGRDEEVQEAAESIPAVLGLQDPEQLAEDRGGRGVKRRVEPRERVLHGGIEGLRVLEGNSNRQSCPGHRRLKGPRHPPGAARTLLCSDPLQWKAPGRPWGAAPELPAVPASKPDLGGGLPGKTTGCSPAGWLSASKGPFTPPSRTLPRPPALRAPARQCPTSCDLPQTQLASRGPPCA